MHLLTHVLLPPTPHPSLSAVGILVCIGTTFIATDLKPARVIADIEHTLKMQLIISTALMTPVRTREERVGYEVQLA